ncbi:MAG TPA: DUF5723 family protein [Flavobacteriales bacterium]|nr:DUF5723 family protein [Flavobacteriales bacterium]
MKHALPILLICFSCFKSNAQDMLGFMNSNYAGVTGLYLQPASIVDSRFRTDISLFGVSVNAYNNYIGLKPDALIRDGGLFKGPYPAFADTAFQDKYLYERSNNINKSVFVSQQVTLPAFSMNFGKHHNRSMAFSWRVRNYVNIDGVEPELAKLIYNELNYPQFFTRLQNERLSVQQMTWGEYGITYGQVIKDNGKHFMKAAATLKILQGLAASYMYIENLDYNFTTDSTVSIFSTDVNYGHSTNYEFTGESLKYKYISNFSVGGDLGFVYEYRPKYQDYRYEMDNEKDLEMKYKNEYKLKVGVSVLDIGGLKFEKGAKSNDFTANVNLWNLNLLQFDSIPVEAFDDTLIARFGQKQTEKTFFMNLPTALSLQVDYCLYKDFYINHTTYYSFQFRKNANKVHDITTFSLTPRWDHKYFGIFLPVSYNLMGNFGTGFGFRIGFLYMGTSNVGPIWAALTQKGKRDIYGADFAVVLKLPILERKPKDRDNDKISDKKDKCPDVPGVWEFMGCSDKDGDHIQDTEDACPDVAGVMEFKGCPDRDGDKIVDHEDACPDDAGLAEFKGCPDKDGDKVIDKEDECPDVAGLAAFKGCPDKDGDGLQDSKDDCPDEYGFVSMNGCPDKDGDGLPDKQDRCPEKPGPIKNLGCPELKLQLLTSNLTLLEEVSMEDGKFNFSQCVEKAKALFKIFGEGSDTVRKVLITCPELRGKHAYLDKDGLFRFPKEVEKVELTPQEEEIVKKAFDNLEFATGKDIIKKESYASLDELAGLMAKHTGWKLRIEGHTDNVGVRAKNMVLSQKRAEAVKKYLSKKGIDAKRFEVKWFGPDKPLVPNDSEANRQKNRRVEMTIME